MVKEIVKKGDPVLGKKCHDVTRFDQKLHNLLDDMRDTLQVSEGIGLAAPQVGILRRVVVVMNEREEIIELVNPEIVSSSGEQTGLEGCLSLPGYFGEVTRPMKVRVKAQDRNGNPIEVEDEGLTARCFCHELAHLDGHLFDELCDKLYTSEEIQAMFEDAAEDGREELKARRKQEARKKKEARREQEREKEKEKEA